MFNKLLIASASCINEFASEVPQSVFFSIDTSLAQRIRELAAYVKENDLYVAEFFFYDCRRLHLLKVTVTGRKPCSGTSCRPLARKQLPSGS